MLDLRMGRLRQTEGLALTMLALLLALIGIALGLWLLWVNLTGRVAQWMNDHDQF